MFALYRFGRFRVDVLWRMLSLIDLSFGCITLSRLAAKPLGNRGMVAMRIVIDSQSV